MEQKEFWIYLSDLTPEAREGLLAEIDIPEAEGNYDLSPIAIVPIEVQSIAQTLEEGI